MFGNSKKEVELLTEKITQLTQKIEELKNSHDEQIKILRRQFSALVMGYPPSPSSILGGLPYSEVPKEEVVSFIKQTPNLLILDVRSDHGWTNGHIPNAKHIPAWQVSSRLMELADKKRPILTICANGNTGVTIAQLLSHEGYRYVYNALGGMAGYKGDLDRSAMEASDVGAIRGSDPSLIRKVAQVMDRDIRPGLKRDGGDLKILSIEKGIVQVKMVGACLGCGAQKRTVEAGIKNHLMRLVPEIVGIEDLS